MRAAKKESKSRMANPAKEKREAPLTGSGDKSHSFQQMSPANPSKLVMKAHRLAVESRENAYAPYSSFKVGAGLISSTGRIYGGCNIENASYGGAVCAERTALLKAVSDGDTQFKDIVVVTDAKVPAFPCAFCLQMMAEFFDPETRVWVANKKHIQSVHLFRELLPYPFGPKQLEEAR